VKRKEEGEGKGKAETRSGGVRKPVCVAHGRGEPRERRQKRKKKKGERKGVKAGARSQDGQRQFPRRTLLPGDGAPEGEEKKEKKRRKWVSARAWG